MRQFVYNWYIFNKELDFLEQGHATDVSNYNFEEFGLLKGEEKTFFASVKEIAKKAYKEIKTVYPSYFDKDNKRAKIVLPRGYDPNADTLRIQIHNLKEGKDFFVELIVLFLA